MEDKVFQCLQRAQKPMRPGEISEALDMGKKDVEKALKKLRDEDKVHSPVRCFYAIK